MGTYKTIKLKRGLDLNLQGNISPQSEVPQGARMPIKGEEYAIVPDDFTAIIPRMEVKEGDHVDAGDVLYHDKTFEMIKVTSPVSGTVKAVVRGERRKIERIVIESDGNDTHHEFDVNDDVKKLMLDSGIWVMMRQRPYDVVPSPEVEPRDIFVTCFDSAPLAPNLSLFVKDRQKELDVAAKALKTLTTGNIYLGCRHGDEIEIDGCITTSFVGPHPAGNAGIQAANVMPVNKGDVVWTLDIVTLMRLGKLLTTGKMCFETLVAVTGDQVAEPRYERAIMGCTIRCYTKTCAKMTRKNVSSAATCSPARKFLPTASFALPTGTSQ